MFNWAMKPLTDKPSIYAKRISDKISPANKEGSAIRGFLSGAIEGAGDLVSDATSPLSIAGMAIGATPWIRGGRALNTLGRIEEFRPRAGGGIPAFDLPPDLVSSGAESIYNSTRRLPVSRTVEDIAYDVVRNPDRPGKNITGDFNLADMISKLNSARKK